MGRRKKVSDRHVLEAALAVLADGGRERFTLARVAAAGGVSAATLVQRFASREGLLTAACAYANGWIRAWLEANTEREVPRLLGDLAAGFGPAGRRFGGHLSFLREELAEPTLAQLAAERMATIRAAVADRLDLRPGSHPADRAQTVELIEAHFNGAVLQWAIRPQGRLSTHVERSLRDLIARLRL